MRTDARTRKRFLKKIERTKGFTLIEILSVVVILGIIFAGVSVSQLSQAEYLRKLNFAKDVLDINEAIASYIFFEPLDSDAEKLSVELLIRRGHLVGENRSPWGTPYKIVIVDNSIVIETEDATGRKVKI